MASSFWGWVRQPNYVGEILICLASAALIGRFSCVPLILILSPIVLLAIRARRVNQHNDNKYNSAWTQYCKRVKNLLIPNVY